MLIKRFLEWIKLKKKLDSNKHSAPYVSEGEIWWISVGENIGSEISGKSHRFSRPAIILKKLSHGFYFVIPTTSQKRTGSWYTKFRHHGKNMAACLHQVRTIDYRRLCSKLGRLDDSDFTTVKAGFRKLYF